MANIAITDAVMGTEILHYLSVSSFYVAYAIQSVKMLNFSFKNSKFTPFYCFLRLFLSTCNFASETPVLTCIDPCHVAAILSQEISKALFMHG